MVIEEGEVGAEIGFFWVGEVREGGGGVDQVEGVFVDLDDCLHVRGRSYCACVGRWGWGWGNALLPSSPSNMPSQGT